MMNQGWLKLFYRFKEWEWYHDKNTKVLFIHLLLCANFKDVKRSGVLIPRGSLMTTRAKLVEETNLSAREVRTSLERLNSTNEIAIKTTNKYTLITICKFEEYQGETNENDQQNDQQNDQRATSKRPANDQQTTSLYIEEGKKEINKERKYYVVVEEGGRKIEADEFLKSFFADHRRASIEQTCLSYHFGTIENFKALAGRVVADWATMEERPKKDLSTAYRHLVHHCNQKNINEQREAKEAARTTSRGANQANDKAPRNVNDQWAGIQMPTH